MMQDSNLSYKSENDPSTRNYLLQIVQRKIHFLQMRKNNSKYKWFDQDHTQLIKQPVEQVILNLPGTASCHLKTNHYVRNHELQRTKDQKPSSKDQNRELNQALVGSRKTLFKIRNNRLVILLLKKKQVLASQQTQRN